MRQTMKWKPADAFREISRGNQSAEDFMVALYIWVHAQDDLCDRDKPVLPEVFAGFNFNILHTFAKNPFFREHQDFILPVLLVGALAWVASEDRKNSPDVLERFTGQVLKSQYGDVFFAVAFIIGGFDHAVAMFRKYREYDFDVEPVKKLDNEASLRQTEGKGA
jgi:hypothetical protein